MLKKIGIVAAAVVLVFLIVGYFVIYRPYAKIRAQANVLLAGAKEMKQVFSQNNIDLLSAKMDAFAKNYDLFAKEASSVYWASFIPYVADFKNTVEAGGYLVNAGKETIVAVSPYADLIGFKKGAVSFVERSSEDRLQTAVLTLDKVLTKIDTISDDVKQADIRISKINPKRYPKQLGALKLRDSIENAQEQFKGLNSLLVDAKPLLKRLPEIFGKDKEKTYLLLFQNDKELRATGGFLTSYAIFKVKDGKIRIEKSEDIYSLDNEISHPVAPREVASYHKDVTRFYIRDSNLSPDLPTSIELFDSLYKQASSRAKFDGVITLDSKVLVDMLTIFGDTEADGVVFSAQTDKRCNCPQVLYQLFDMIDRPVNYIKTNRKGILGDLMYVLFYKAIGFSPSKYWGTLAQQMFKNMQEKHIMLYFVDSDLQKSVESLNFAGKIRNYDGDYLHVNNVNFAGAKSNMFVSQSITSKTKTSGGTTTREVTVEFKNPYPHSDCNLERGGLCLNATLRDWIRVYVPKGSKLISFKGSETKVQTYDELGKTVFEGFLQVPTEGMAKVIVEYSLPASVNSKDYHLLIQKQPGTYQDKVKVEVDGKNAYTGDLMTDREIRLK